MNAFVRQLAALSVLWSFCELLLPDGRQRHMARLTVSVLVTTALVSALTSLPNGAAATWRPAQTVLARSAAEDRYDQIVLSAVANQAEGLCVRMAEKVGYRARAAVYLHGDGSLQRVDMRLSPREGTTPMMNPEALATGVAQALCAQREQIVVRVPEAYDGNGADDS